MTAPAPDRFARWQHYGPMLGFGLLWQACASGRFAFAAAAWMCLLPLAVFVRVARWPWALAGAFGVVFVGRAVAWVGVVDDGVTAAACAALLTTAALFLYRHVMRELPRWGSVALPVAVVVIEALARRAGLPGAALLPLSTTQAADVPLWRFVDVLTPAGVSFCVAFGQAAMAGFGESWLAEDPHDQATRERGLWLGANAAFWVVAVVLHLGGFLRAAPAGTGSVALVDAWEGLCALLAIALTAAAAAVRLRRTAPPSTTSATSATSTTSATAAATP